MSIFLTLFLLFQYPDDLAEPDNYQDPMLDEAVTDIPGAHIPIDEPIDEVDLDEPMDNAYGDMENSECSDKIQRILRKAKDKLSDQHSVAMQAYEMLKEILEEEELEDTF